MGEELDGHRKNFNKEIENIRKYQTEVMTGLKNTVEGYDSRTDEIEAQTNKLAGKAMENIQTEQRTEKKKRKKRSDDALKTLCDNIKGK